MIDKHCLKKINRCVWFVSRRTLIRHRSESVIRCHALRSQRNGSIRLDARRQFNYPRWFMGTKLSYVSDLQCISIFLRALRLLLSPRVFKRFIFFLPFPLRLFDWHEGCQALCLAWINVRLSGCLLFTGWWLATVWQTGSYPTCQYILLACLPTHHLSPSLPPWKEKK